METVKDQKGYFSVHTVYIKEVFALLHSRDSKGIFLLWRGDSQ